jgi:hypothetical protein
MRRGHHTSRVLQALGDAGSFADAGNAQSWTGPQAETADEIIPPEFSN